MSTIIAQFSDTLPAGFILMLFSAGIVLAVLVAIFSFPNERL